MAPLEPITERRFIELIVQGEDRWRILQAVHNEPATPRELEHDCSVPYSSVHGKIQSLESVGAIESNGKPETTLIGDLAIQACTTACSEIDGDEDRGDEGGDEEWSDEKGRKRLAYLTGSDNRINLLRTLRNCSAQRADLKRRDDLPSEATIDRIFTSFAEFDWIKRDNQYHLTTEGHHALHEYEILEHTIEQVITYGPFLRRLGDVGKEIPVRALAGADIWQSSPTEPYEALDGFLELCDPELDQVRVLCPIFAPPLFDAYSELVDMGVQGECIDDESIYEKLRQPKNERHLQQVADLGAENFFVLPETITFGIVLYDDSGVAIGAYREGHKEHIALISSDDPALVEWATDIYEQYREKAHVTEVSREMTA